MNRDDYIQEVEALRAPAALRSRIAALPQQAIGRRRARAALRAVGMAACAACILLAVYGASVLWNMTHRGGDLRPYPPVLTAPPSTPTPRPTSTPEPTPTAPGWSEGEGYSYTSEDLGITVEFPPEWKEYVSFREEQRDRCLQRDNGERLDAAVLFLMPPEDTADKIYQDWQELFLSDPYSHSFAQICWVPNGMRWQESTGCTYVTLWENDEGKYVGRYDPMELSISYSLASWSLVSDPADRERLHTACEAVQSGLRDGQYRVESLHAPEAPVSAVHAWAGSGYSYTSENLGVTVEFPPEWREYFTFQESGSFINLMADWEGDETERYLGCVYFEPNGETVHSGDDGVSIVLAETDQGRYWLYMSGMTHMLWTEHFDDIPYVPEIAQTADTIWYGLTEEDLWEIRLNHPPVLPRPTVAPEPTPTPTPEPTPAPTPTPITYTTVPSGGLVNEAINVPDDVRNAAVEWVTERYATYVENPDGAWRHPDAVYDNWRIDAIEPCEYLSGLAYRPVQVYRLSWQLHTTTPELGGNQAGAYQPVVAGWFTPGYGCDYLAFLCTDDHDYFFAYLMINDVSPGSDAFSSDVERSLLARIPAPTPEVETYQDPGVPDRVIYQAGEYIKDQYLLAHLPQTYGEAASRPAGSYDDDWAVDVLPDFDDWRITSVNKCYEVSMEDLAPGLGTAVVYRLDYQLHTTTPEKLQPLLADGQLLDGDGWFTQRPNGVYLVFRMSNEGLLTFLSVLPESDASPSSQPFQEAVTQSLTGSGYILGYMASTLAGVEIGAPLEKQPAELLAALTPQGDPWEGTPWHTKDPAWSICQRYTAPGIEIITSKVPPEKLESYLHAYDANDPEALAALLEESGASSVEAIYGQEIDREYVARITVTGPEYATNLGVRVGMTRSEVQALYQRLAGGKAISNQTIMEASISIEYTGDKVSKIEVHDMLGRRVGRFFDL